MRPKTKKTTKSKDTVVPERPIVPGTPLYKLLEVMAHCVAKNIIKRRDAEKKA
ncbi:MAG TPA: hypothetical protein VH253_12965 [Phycisphaerae bacterium]|nr:hypothetical protein [Phycisphaerae bacterium]